MKDPVYRPVISAVRTLFFVQGTRFTIAGEGPLAPVGPATMMAGKLLVPVAEGLAVYNPADGVQERVIALAHPPGTGPVRPAVLGQMVIEQRDATVAAYGPG